MRRRLALTLVPTLALTFFLVSCTGIKVVHDVDPEADFSRYRTWAWISEENLIGAKGGEVAVSYVSPIDEKRIRRAVEANLSAKGYRVVPAAEADLILTFTIGTQEKTQIYTTPTGGYYDDYGYAYGYGDWYGGSEVRSRQYTEGTLSVQVFDRAAKSAVWVGWASKRVSRSDDSDKVIREAVAKILQTLPAAG